MKPAISERIIGMEIGASRQHYNSVYNQNDYFGQNKFLYREFISALIQKIGIPENSLTLDVGSGQGFLSYYLSCNQLNVYCTDLSIVGLRSLNRYNTVFEGKRILADILHHPFKEKFDLVFSRSCSLHNEHFKGNTVDFVARLLDCVKPGGMVCIIYNSNLSGEGLSWFNPTFSAFMHSIESASLCDLEYYAVNKIDTVMLGRHSFCRFITKMNASLAPLSKKSCELVAIGRKIKRSEITNLRG